MRIYLNYKTRVRHAWRSFAKSLYARGQHVTSFTRDLVLYMKFVPVSGQTLNFLLKDGDTFAEDFRTFGLFVVLSYWDNTGRCHQRDESVAFVRTKAVAAAGHSEKVVQVRTRSSRQSSVQRRPRCSQSVFSSSSIDQPGCESKNERGRPWCRCFSYEHEL